MNEKEIKQTIENTFDDVSSLYDINEYFVITAKEMIKDLKVKNNSKVLDLSCGTGNVCLPLALKFPSSKIDAIDLSSSMLDIAMNKAKDLNIKNINFKKDDVTCLAYKKNSLDLITCGFGLFFYPNMSKSLNEFLSFLKKDANLVFTSFIKDAFSPYVNLFFERLKNDYNLEYTNEAFLDTKEEIKALILGVCDYKFEIEEVKISRFITVSQWWDTLNSAGFKTMLNKLSKDDLTTFKKEHLKEITNLSKNNKIELITNTYITKIYK